MQTLLDMWVCEMKRGTVKTFVQCRQVTGVVSD